MHVPRFQLFTEYADRRPHLPSQVPGVVVVSRHGGVLRGRDDWLWNAAWSLVVGGSHVVTVRFLGQPLDNSVTNTTPRY